ncbi:hypothetical protein AVEN_270395-1 [Araneus ventricosus]|uniref:Uncharacterized protein n=1 Tax=Araneus ventricosus TaxID=182803 RepID=A0A4Y2TEH0_ARAVE|nr:hypothetical protein AVEN_270395-1 [Araneus ventricosus]
MILTLTTLAGAQTKTQSKEIIESHLLTKPDSTSSPNRFGNYSASSLDLALTKDFLYPYVSLAAKGSERRVLFLKLEVDPRRVRLYGKCIRGLAPTTLQNVGRSSSVSGTKRVRAYCPTARRKTLSRVASNREVEGRRDMDIKSTATFGKLSALPLG